MAKLTVIEYPDPRLRRRARPVTEFDRELHGLVDDLVETLLAAGSAMGLSAPQVDDDRQVLVMSLAGDPSAPQVYVNPRILRRAGLGLAEETCLSVPGEVVKVWRSAAVSVRAQDRNGEPFERELEGLPAVCLQHEMDHLEGKLLVDRMWFLRRRRYDRRLETSPGTAARA